jgi:protein-disulfide isomerase
MSLRLIRAAFLAAPFAIAACSQASSEAPAGEAAKPSASAAKFEILPTDMVMGKADAPVTLIEYASVTCPHCAAVNEQIIPKIKEKFIETGKLKLVFREFPTAPASFSIIGSLLARCAAEKAGPEAYFLVTDALFRRQQTWVSKDARAELVKIVAQAGMDEAAVDACVKREDLQKVINDNATVALEKYKVGGTPTFFLNGEKLPIKSPEEFEKAIADAVAKAGA